MKSLFHFLCSGGKRRSPKLTANYLSESAYQQKMAERYYVDTSIWMDLLEDRKGFNGELLGVYALKLFAMIKAKNHKLVLSDLLIKELKSNYSLQKIN